MKFVELTIIATCILGIFSVLGLSYIHIAPSYAEATALPAEAAVAAVIKADVPAADVLVITSISSTSEAVATTSNEETKRPSAAISPKTRPTAKPAVTKTISPTSQPAAIARPKPTPTVTPAGGYSLTTVNRQIHSRTNTARSQKGLATLSVDPTLAAIAQSRSEDMIKNNYFAHASTLSCDIACRFAKLNYVTLTYGENLAEYEKYQTLSENELAATILHMWLNSPSHRANLLSPKYNREGIGVAAKNDRVVVTVIFSAQ